MHGATVSVRISVAVLIITLFTQFVERYEGIDLLSHVSNGVDEAGITDICRRGDTRVGRVVELVLF